MYQALHLRGGTGKIARWNDQNVKPVDGKLYSQKVAKIQGSACSVPVINATLKTNFAQIVSYTKICRRFSQHTLTVSFLVITRGNSCRLIRTPHFLAITASKGILASIAIVAFP